MSKFDDAVKQTWFLSNAVQKEQSRIPTSPKQKENFLFIFIIKRASLLRQLPVLFVCFYRGLYSSAKLTSRSDPFEGAFAIRLLDTNESNLALPYVSRMQYPSTIPQKLCLVLVLTTTQSWALDHLIFSRLLFSLE